MFIIKYLRKYKIYIIAAMVVIVFTIAAGIIPYTLPGIFVTDELFQDFNDIFDIRNRAVLENDLETLESLYNRSTKLGNWAYEHEIKKIEYLKSWSDKQGIKFTDIRSKIEIRRVKAKGDRLSANIVRSTEYDYIYLDQPDTKNMFRIGTYHSIEVDTLNNDIKIVREWYTDPFADSLILDDAKSEKVKEIIKSSTYRDLSDLNKRRLDALAYADMYCGAAADEEYGFKYNKKYRDYNPLGGDCANFASQILFEGGKFKKTGTWNYDNGGSRAWVNADGFNSFMLGSGRASLIARGSYDKVLKLSYKLLPGDYVAYEKGGEIVHISVVTGSDSRGYSLVNCHNTDRYRVP